ncbi:MAG: class I SAM-dependent methyltransferase [Euryarchaeota archaeon]|nr:class I SAM-dependent methyltransferase [Euryarchaeota archaeon]
MPAMEQAAAEEHFRSLVPDRGPVLERLEKEAAERDIPIVGPSLGNLLYLLTLTSMSQKVLELGTATGYSTIWLAKAAQNLQGRVHTYERDAKLAEEAKRNIKDAGYHNIVTVHTEDITEALPKMADSFSLIFVDIEKEAYAQVLPDLVDILKPRGLLIADNAGFEEVRSFNERLAKTDGFDTAFLHGFFAGHSPERDGLAIARKRVS